MKFSYPWRSAFVAWAVGVAMMAVPAFARAQDVAGTAPTLKVESKLVSLDVIVTDDKGQPAPGLKKEDFTVFEDNKLQMIHNFNSWEKRPEVPTKATVDHYGRPDWGDSPIAIIVLDQISTDFSDASYAAQMLERYLKAEPEIMPVPTMLLLVTDDGYKTLLPFTRDRAALLKAVAKRPPVLPSRLMRGDGDVIMVQSFLVLQQIALAEAGLAQHKSIIWVGAGFNGVDMTELDEQSADSLKKAIRTTVDLLMNTHTTVFKIDPVAQGTSTAPETDPDSIDATGVDVGGTLGPGEDPLDDNFNFNEFAVQTGGSYFYGQNDLDRYFRHSLEQTDEFYTLTYRPPADEEGGAELYRKIRVTVDKPGLHVVTRTGFYTGVPPEPPVTKLELGASLSSVAAGDMSFSGVGVNVIGLEPGKNPGSLRITFEVEDRSLDWTPGANGVFTAKATAVLVALDAKKNVIDSAAFQLPVYLKAADAKQRFTAALTVRDEVAVTAKTANVRIIVRDGSGRIGTADISPEAFTDVLAQLPAKGKKK
jgi:VWFA-related protein